MVVTDLGELIHSFSKALDLSATGVAYHHQTVALIALAIARQMGLEKHEKDILYLSAQVHDAGITSRLEMDEMVNFKPQNPLPHCQEGFNTFNPSRHLRELATLILHHHDRWEGPNPSGLEREGIPLGSAVINLADRVAVLVEKTEGYVLHHHKEIINRITRESGKLFRPDVVEAFRDVATREAFWLDLELDFLSDLVRQRQPARVIRLTLADLEEISFCFAQIIDNKSHFTRCHSERVANVAYYLAKQVGFSEYEQTLIKVAGYLHDIGKITIPAEILDKPGRLTEDEFAIIKKHTYYSYRLLRNIPGLELVAAWGPHHHEKLDGSGYPFGLQREKISIGARIMAVADIFTALSEDRPYRPGMGRVECLQIIKGAIDKGHIDPFVAGLVEKYYEDLALLVHSC